LTIKKIAASNNIKLQNQAEATAFLNKLAEAISTLPTVHLTLAVAPKMQLIKTISQWFIATYQKTVLLDIKVEPSLMAGSIVEFNGRYKDYSLKKSITASNAADMNTTINKS
jgi:F0F1-type ATP synthase delta subunit